MIVGPCVLDHNKVKSDFEEGKVLDLCTGKWHLQQISLLCIFFLQRHKTARWHAGSCTTNVGKEPTVSHWLFYT